MKVVTVANGNLSMYIQPESEIDKAIIAELFKGPVDSTIHATIRVGTKDIQNCVEITPAAPVKIIEP